LTLFRDVKETARRKAGHELALCLDSKGCIEYGVHTGLDDRFATCTPTLSTCDLVECRERKTSFMVNREVAMKAPFLALTVALLLVTTVIVAQDSGKHSPALMRTSLGKLPIYFIENRGVYPDAVKFYIQGADKTLFFTNDGVTFALRGKERGWTVKLDFVGARKDVAPRGEDQQQAVFSYFKGPEKDWKAGLPTFATVVYRDLWPGIDLVYKGTVNKLKYEFVVAPGADPTKIRLRYRGADKLTITTDDALHVTTPEGGYEDAPPMAWQVVNGRRVPVEMAYALGKGGEFGFDLGDYDRARPIVLDPAVLVYCGYIGGSGEDFGYGIAVDTSGNAYVAGAVGGTTPTFPVKTGPSTVHSGGLLDAFVAKVRADGTGFVYCGFIGGRGLDSAAAIAVDTAGNAYVAGDTMSSPAMGFPVKTGPITIYRGGFSRGDAFVAKVNAAGTALVYCGYVGGVADDFATGVAVDGNGRAYVTGNTTSAPTHGFPVKTGPVLTHHGGFALAPYDAFIARVKADGSGFDYCGYVGGSGMEYGTGVAVDGNGRAYVTGYTSSTETQKFPVKVGPDLTHNGGGSQFPQDVYVARVNAAGTGFEFCGYVGGSGDDYSYGVAVDPAGNSYVCGNTTSGNTFPVKVGPSLAPGKVFATRVSATGRTLDWSGFVPGADLAEGIAVDGAGGVYVTGNAGQGLAVKGGLGPTFNGAVDAYLVKIYPAGTGFEFGGYVGGANSDWGRGVAVDPQGNAYVTGETSSPTPTFPVKVGPGLAYGALRDAFVFKVAQTTLQGSGTPRPGGRITLDLHASISAGLAYQAGSSLGTGPIPLGNKRKIDLSPDSLLVATVIGLWPSIFTAYRGVIDSKGQAKAAISIPGFPALIGVRLHTAFVTLHPPAPSGIRSISNTFSFSITK